MAKKILLIDDEELIIKSVGRLLVKEGYEVVCCNNGKEAVEIAQDSKISLVICDIRMPGLNGVETILKIRQIRAERGHESIPEIFISGYAEDSALKDAENLKVSDCLYKPFDLRVFLDRIRQHIGK